MCKAQKTQLKFDPLVLHWFFQENKDKNQQHIQLLTKTKIDSKILISCHSNYRGNGSLNDYIMIKYTTNQAITPTNKFSSAKLVARFAEPIEDINATFLHPTYILV